MQTWAVEKESTTSRRFNACPPANHDASTQAVRQLDTEMARREGAMWPLSCSSFFLRLPHSSPGGRRRHQTQTFEAPSEAHRLLGRGPEF